MDTTGNHASTETPLQNPAPALPGSSKTTVPATERQKQAATNDVLRKAFGELKKLGVSKADSDSLISSLTKLGTKDHPVRELKDLHDHTKKILKDDEKAKKFTGDLVDFVNDVAKHDPDPNAKGLDLITKAAQDFEKESFFTQKGPNPDENPFLAAARPKGDGEKEKDDEKKKEEAKKDTPRAAPSKEAGAKPALSADDFAKLKALFGGKDKDDKDKGDGDKGKGGGGDGQQAGGSGGGDNKGGGDDDRNQNNDKANKALEHLAKGLKKQNAQPQSNGEQKNQNGGEKKDDKKGDDGSDFNFANKQNDKDKIEPPRPKAKAGDLMGGKGPDANDPTLSPAEGGDIVKAARNGLGNFETTVPQSMASAGSVDPTSPFGGGFGGGLGGGSGSGFGGNVRMPGQGQGAEKSGGEENAFFAGMNLEGEPGGYGSSSKKNYGVAVDVMASSSGISGSGPSGEGDEGPDGDSQPLKNNAEQYAKQIYIPPVSKQNDRSVSGKPGTIFDIATNGNLCTGERKTRLAVCTHLARRPKPGLRPFGLGDRT